MKLLLSLIPILSNLNGVNSLKTFVQNDGYTYNLSNLKTNHFYLKNEFLSNDININLYGLVDIGTTIFDVYKQIAYSLDQKYNKNESEDFDGITGCFLRLITKSANYPSNILKLKILDSSDNWLNNQIVTKVTTDYVISMQSFKSIEKETNNEVYSLNLAASINDDEWDPNGIFYFSVNITSINYTKPINIFSKEIQDFGLDSNHGLITSSSSANGNTSSTSKINSDGSYDNGAYIFPFTSISNLFENVDEFAPINYIDKFYLNFSLNTYTFYSNEGNQSRIKDNINQQFDIFNDYRNLIDLPPISGDSRLFNDSLDKVDIAKEENPYDNSKIKNIKNDCISGNIYQSFWWGNSGNTSSYFTKYIGHVPKKIGFGIDYSYFLFRVFTIGCGTSSSSYTFSIHFKINSFTCKFKSDIWDNIPK